MAGPTRGPGSPRSPLAPGSPAPGAPCQGKARARPCPCCSSLLPAVPCPTPCHGTPHRTPPTPGAWHRVGSHVPPSRVVSASPRGGCSRDTPPEERPHTGLSPSYLVTLQARGPLYTLKERRGVREPQGEGTKHPWGSHSRSCPVLESPVTPSPRAGDRKVHRGVPITLPRLGGARAEPAHPGTLQPRTHGRPWGPHGSRWSRGAISPGKTKQTLPGKHSEVAADMGRSWQGPCWHCLRVWGHPDRQVRALAIGFTLSPGGPGEPGWPLSPLRPGCPGVPAMPAKPGGPGGPGKPMSPCRREEKDGAQGNSPPGVCFSHGITWVSGTW